MSYHLRSIRNRTCGAGGERFGEYPRVAHVVQLSDRGQFRQRPLTNRDFRSGTCPRRHERRRDSPDCILAHRAIGRDLLPNLKARPGLHAGSSSSLMLTTGGCSNWLAGVPGRVGMLGWLDGHRSSGGDAVFARRLLRLGRLRRGGLCTATIRPNESESDKRFPVYCSASLTLILSASIRSAFGKYPSADR